MKEQSKNNLLPYDHQYSSQDIKILAKETLFDGFFKLIKYRFQHKLFAGGWSEVVERELFERGHAAAMLPYDPIRDEVVIIEQVRVGALEHENPWQYEIVAGMLDSDESAETVVKREAVEEAGIEVKALSYLTSFYPSSGGCSEKLDVFVGHVDTRTAMGIHGLDYENEDIRVQVLSRETAYQWLLDGRFENAATIISLQWLMLNYHTLQAQW